MQKELQQYANGKDKKYVRNSVMTTYDNGNVGRSSIEITEDVYKSSDGKRNAMLSYEVSITESKSMSGLSKDADAYVNLTQRERKKFGSFKEAKSYEKKLVAKANKYKLN